MAMQAAATWSMIANRRFCTLSPCDQSQAQRMGPTAGIDIDKRK